MTKLPVLFFLSAVLAAGSFCSAETQVKAVLTSNGWIKYENNPLIGGEKLGTCFDVTMLRENGEYRMWFSWRPQKSLAYTESKDGIHWLEPKIVLGPNPDTDWETDINRPCILKRNGVYHLWYTGQTKDKSWIGYATSSDGLSWKRVSNKPVLSAEAAWEKVAVMCPHVEWDDTVKLYKMWYSGGRQIEPDAIGYAESPDGVNWTKHTQNPIFSADKKNKWEQDRVTGGQIIRQGDWYVMFYIGFENEYLARIGIARSKDGITNWERLPSNPIISPDKDKWDGHACYKPFAIYDAAEKKWRLWYNGRIMNLERIGLAVHDGEDLGFPNIDVPNTYVSNVEVQNRQQTKDISTTAQETNNSAALTAVPFTAVHFNDTFWSPRLAVNREISIPHNYEWCEKTGRFTNFAKAAHLKDGKFEGIYFNDSDVYKVLEGTAYSLADHPDSALEQRADAVIDWIAKAQQPNGYLNSYFQLAAPDKKWTDVSKHELYCAGHLIEAAAAYKRATGKDTLLNVAEKFTDNIIEVFLNEKSSKFDVPGHEEIELALVKLYQLTGKKKYFALSEHFIDIRGDRPKRKDKIHGPYQQDHEPLRKANEITGHAVRAAYLYAGATDIAAYTGDKQLTEAMDRLWNDVVNKKMYITGGIGARHAGEAFGDAYELPNRTAYCETCAAIGLVFWADRMNRLHGAENDSAKYADVVERAMYNGVLAGIGLDGKHFFYVNPLESTGNHHRQPFFDCACCPTNVVRFLPSLPGYQYAVKDNTIYVNQYIAGTATLQLKDGEVTITQDTNYPWDGKVKFTFDRKPKDGVAGQFDLKIRNASQALNYHNYGIIVHIPWHTDAVEELISSNLAVITKRLIAHPKVTADNGRVAVQRGPLVYCFEQCDNEVPVPQITLAKNPEFTEEFKDIGLPGGQKVIVLKCKNADGRELTAVPYFAWDHRKAGAMSVWVRQQGLSRKNPPDTRGQLYTELLDTMLQSADEESEPLLSASFCHSADAIEAAADGIEPKNSGDHDIPRMTFWNHKGTAEWIEIDFGKAGKVSQSGVYWFDDTGRGECRVPQSWKLLYKNADNQFVPVKTAEAFGTDVFGTAKDKYNTVKFEEVETSALRLEIQLQKNYSGGVLEWKTE